ncbi:MAG: hypothetical protein WDN44_02065 [Sphingomonas sp.]
MTISLVGRPTPAVQPGGTYTVDQKNIQFHPFVLVVPLNSNVSFPNLDPVRHHVYSFSPAKRFELKLYAREQNRSVRFDKAGVVALGLQHPRPDDRVHRRGRHALGGEDPMPRATSC